MLRRSARRTIPLMAVPGVKRKMLAHLEANHAMSQCRACRVIGCCRMTVRYEMARQDDPVVRERWKILSKARRRFGYRIRKDSVLWHTRCTPGSC